MLWIELVITSMQRKEIIKNLRGLLFKGVATSSYVTYGYAI